MHPDSVASFADALRDAHLLETTQLDELTQAFQAHFPEPKALAAELIRRGWLTPYQANQLLRGRGPELLLGSYVLLEKLGEGGMGQVFKAKNWKLGRIVALKLIRKERLENADAVRRFQREIRAAAQLDHPNIVRAYDADEVGGTHLLVMEYVEGADLAQLVKQHGTLPVAQACEWVRQAAVGLQHAHERGLVHRDIKPHNLLRTKQGAVKILDMGLARLTVAGGDEEASTTMTQEGAVMGTPDYMAPEQAEESHSVDSRADIYSLGCTLYFLLTGKPPFPGGTLIQKLKKHQFEQAVPVEQRRADVPPAVAAVVRKLMAKRPEERYQTATQLAAALAEAAESSPAAGVGRGVSDPVAQTFDFRPTDDTGQPMITERPLGRRIGKRRPLWGVAGAGVLSLCVLAAVWFRARRTGPEQEPLRQPVVQEKATPRRDAEDFDTWVQQVAAMPTERQIKAVAAKLKECNPGFDGTVKPKIEDGAVTGLEFLTANVTDLTPVRALPELIWLSCPGRRDVPGPQGGLTDLSPLKSLRLSYLDCSYTRVAELSPLQGQPLVYLSCHGTQVTDLSPLRKMSLTGLGCADTRVHDLSPLRGQRLGHLNCNGTPIRDLSPLRDMPLTSLLCQAAEIADLSPLRGMRLTSLECGHTGVTDLSPLKGMPLEKLLCEKLNLPDLEVLRGMPLKELWCDFKPERDTALLRSIETLEKINGKPAAAFWKEAGSTPTPRP